MNIKKIFFALTVVTLMIGSACAAGVNNLKIDGYNNTYNSNYSSTYISNDGNYGAYIYKNINSNLYDDDGPYDYDDDDYFDYDDDPYDYDDDCYGYHALDIDSQVTKNQDNTASFTDYDDAEHGIIEVVQIGGEKYTVVFWAKDSSNTNNTNLMSKLNDFNKDNGVSPVAF